MRYGIEESGSTQTESVSEDSAITEVTICGLKDTSTYAIEVAAVNSAGTGEYSDSIAVKTDGKSYLPAGHTNDQLCSRCLSVVMFHTMRLCECMYDVCKWHSAGKCTWFSHCTRGSVLCL